MAISFPVRKQKTGIQNDNPYRGCCQLTALKTQITNRHIDIIIPVFNH